MKAPSIPTLVLVVALTGTFPGRADQQILDDLIVEGSISAGTDSVLNYDFGFDTLVLREGVLRMFFEDTSVSAGFPSNDWRILINGVSGASANYFSIEDSTAVRRLFTLEAGARADSLYVNALGRVGLGTPTPEQGLHLVAGSVPTLRMQQDTTLGNPAYTWDIAASNTEFVIRDVSAGNRLPFRTKPGAPTSSLVLASDGKVGISTASPHARLHVAVNSAAGEGVVIGGAGVLANAATLHVEGTMFVTEDIEIGSSRSRKENIRALTLEEAEGALEELRPVSFNYKEGSETQLGFIAEEVPDLVATNGRNSVAPMDFIAVLTRVVQAHGEREKDLRQTFDEQGRMIASLTERLAALEDEDEASATSEGTQP